MSTIAVVTTLNEEASIARLIADLAHHCKTVIVVDDASTDQTVMRARAAHAIVLEHTERVGIGPSLMQGWREALRLGSGSLPLPDRRALTGSQRASALRVVQIDAGGSHNPHDLYHMLNVDADLVIGSRFVRHAEYTGNPKRALMSRLAAAMCNLAQSGAHWSDWTSGYRVFSGRAIERLLCKTYHARMHGIQIEVLAHAGALGLSIVEEPIRYHAGRSSFNARVAWEAFSVWGNMLHHINAVQTPKAVTS